MPDPISRREFAERLALAAAAPFVTEGLGVRDSGLGMASSSPKPQVQSPDPSALAKALAEGIRLRYGDRLSADDLKAITQGIDARLQGVERLYRVALTNGDEPESRAPSPEPRSICPREGPGRGHPAALRRPALGR